MNSVLEALKAVDGIDVRKAYSTLSFSLVSTIPTVTVGVEEKSGAHEAIDGGEPVISGTILRVCVFTPKKGGGDACRELSERLSKVLYPLAREIHTSKVDYEPTLRHFKVTITLTLPREAESNLINSSHTMEDET